MTSYQHVFAYWCARELALPIKVQNNAHLVLPLYHPKLMIREGFIRSLFGNEMTLVRTLRNSRGKIRCFLINGDQGQTMTERNQQWRARAVLQASGTPCLVVPYRALHTAEIDVDSIRPIEITADRTERIMHHTAGFDAKDIVWKPEAGSATFQTGNISGRPGLVFFRRIAQHKWVRDEKGRSAYTIAPLPPAQRTATIRWRGFIAQVLDDGTVEATENRHRLGDSVFSAQLIGETVRRKFVSSFDYQERWPLYFLAELPRGARVKSVDDAIMALAPPIVHAAIAQGRDVKRQGDMFAIPTELKTKEVRLLTGSAIRKMQGIFGTDHLVTESVVGKNRVTYGRGFIHHRPVGRRPDHRSCHLDKVWHLMVPNAVPRRRRGANAQTGTQTPESAPF